MSSIKLDFMIIHHSYALLSILKLINYIPLNITANPPTFAINHRFDS